MEKQLFGTDGIRGVAGEPPLDPATIFAAGLCLGEHLRSGTSGARVIIGEDPRESSRWIAETAAAGLQEAGAEIQAVGVITTPGLAYLTASEGFAAGVMISASHNPYRDNGIKVFASSGFKLPDEEERQVERRILLALANQSGPTVRRQPQDHDRLLVRKYIEYLRTVAPAPGSLSGQKLVMDCANGSASAMVQEVFSGFGMKLKIICDRPDGRNINLDCGSLHLENLRRAVLEERADLGVAFDGDADRALFVGGTGHLIDGDGVLLAASRHLKRRGLLRGDAVVGTLMTNLGLEHALAREGLKLRRTPVGDKYVLDEMLRSGCNLGGEQSGHVIFRDLATTGDGLLTALEVLRIMAYEQRTLEELLQGLEVFPQTIRNVRVREKIPLENLPQVMDEIRTSQERLGNSGRVVVRYSGTELLARVMVEAETHEEVERSASAIVSAIEHSIGAS
jgi:phosphoglucosamine mutase